MDVKNLTADNVTAIIIEEMTKWDQKTVSVEKRREELTNLSERLIRYFAIFHAQPNQLDGLPGGHPVEAAELAVGRRPSSKQWLMSNATGYVLPPK